MFISAGKDGSRKLVANILDDRPSVISQNRRVMAMAVTERWANTLSARIDSKLRQIFPEGEIYVVSDDEWLGLAGGYYGFPAVPLAEAAKLPNGANVVLFLRNDLVSVEIRRLFANSAVLCVPVASFDPLLDVALYTQRLTMLTDFAAALEQSLYWVNSLAVEQDPLVFDDCAGRPGSRIQTMLTCSLSDELKVDAWLKPRIEVGEWVGVGTLCEVSMTAPSFDDWSAFVIDGTAIASGVLVAEDARRPDEVGFRFSAARKLRDELSARSPVVLRLEEGVLVSVEADGDDFTDAVREATNPAYGLHTIELGIGTNFSVLPHVNWRVNSQLNEGAGVVHLGFGEGISGAHIDFIVAESAHNFRAAT